MDSLGGLFPRRIVENVFSVYVKIQRGEGETCPVLVSTFVRNALNRTTATAFREQRLNRPDCDKFLLALPVIFK